MKRSSLTGGAADASRTGDGKLGAARGRTVAAAAVGVALVLTLATGAVADETSPATLAASLDALFAEYNRTDAPGCALGLYRDGELAYAKGYGMADLEHRVPIGPASIFDLGSTSKQFTAASLALLEQQGALGLDDDVRKHLPELPDYGSPITLRHLLHHTSGLRDYIDLMLLAGVDLDDVTTPAEALAMIARQRELNFPPATEYSYSNSGYFLASLVVERASGRTLREFAREHIFAPLEMGTTSFVDDHTTLLPGRAVGYRSGSDGGYRRDVSYWEQNGDGAVFTNVEDLLRWDRNFYDPRVGGAGLLEELHRRGVLADGETLDYALGLALGKHRGREFVAHGGAWGGYRSELMRLPAERTSVAVLCNVGSADPTALALAVLDVLFAPPGPAPEAPAAAPPVSLDRFVGRYRDPASGAYRQLFLEDGALYYQRGESRSRLTPSGDDAFLVEGLPESQVLAWVLSDAGTPERLEWTDSGQVRATLVPYLPWTPDPDALAALSGRYYSPEIETAFVLDVAEGVLTAEHPKHGPIALEPREEGAFSGSQGLLARVTFERDAEGAVAGFRLTTGRGVRGLLFDRQE